MDVNVFLHPKINLLSRQHIDTGQIPSSVHSKWDKNGTIPYFKGQLETLASVKLLLLAAFYLCVSFLSRTHLAPLNTAAGFLSKYVRGSTRSDHLHNSRRSGFFCNTAVNLIQNQTALFIPKEKLLFPKRISSSVKWAVWIVLGFLRRKSSWLQSKRCSWFSLFFFIYFNVADVSLHENYWPSSPCTRVIGSTRAEPRMERIGEGPL